MKGKKFETILAECLAIVVLYKIMLQPTGEARALPYANLFLEWWGIFVILFLLWLPLTSNIVRLLLSAAAVFLFLIFELHPLSPQSTYFIIAVMFIYYWFASGFRRRKRET